MVTTNDDALAEKVNSLRNHGASVSEEVRHRGAKPYLLPDFRMLGYNYRMTDLQGAVGLVQLGKLDVFLDERRRLSEAYAEGLADVQWLRTPSVPDGWRCGWQAYVCYVDESRSPVTRNEIMEQLQSHGISTRPGTHAVHMQEYYRERLGLADEAFPNARDCDRCTMALPLHNRMSEDDCQWVTSVLKALGKGVSGVGT